MRTLASVLLVFTILANVALLIPNQRYIRLESNMINRGIPDFTELQSAIDTANTASDVSPLSILIAAVGASGAREWPRAPSYPPPLCSAPLATSPTLPPIQ